jgi:Na+-driven multidrug efflux pump
MVVLMAVSGTGMTAAAMRIEMASLVVYMAHVVFSVYTESSPEVVWMAETIYWICMGVFGTIYLRSMKWKGKQL